MNIINLLQQLNIPYRTTGNHARAGWVQIDCPDCGKGSHKYHLGINLQKLSTNCWQCGSKNLPFILSTSSEVPYREIKKLLKEVPRQKVREEVHTGHLQIPFSFQGLSRTHINYLLSRNFNKKEVRQIIPVWGVKGTYHDCPGFTWRLFIPIYFNDEMVSWTTRSIGIKNERRYISASPLQEALHHKDLLYGEDLAGHCIIICEGPLDVWKIGPGAVATFGLSYTQKQVERMKEYPIRVVCFDNSIEAQKRAKLLGYTLSLFPGETHVVKLDADDPGSAKKKEIEQLRTFLR